TVEEAELEPLEVCVQPVAEVELHAERYAAGDQATEHAQHQSNQSGSEDQHNEGPEVRVVGGDLVDRLADEQRYEHAGAHGAGRQQQGQDHSAPVGTEESE